MATKKPWELGSGPFTLYHLHDEEGRLLYIGQSSRPEARILQHKANTTAGWTRLIASWQFFGPFETRAEARAAEAHAITLFTPPWNSVHDGGGKIPCSVTTVVHEIQRRMEACTLPMEDALREVISVTGDYPWQAARRINLRRTKGARTVEQIAAYNLEQAGSQSLHEYFNPRLPDPDPSSLQRLRDLGLLRPYADLR